MSAPQTVHPHLPRFSQGITGMLCLEGVIFRDAWVIAVAAALADATGCAASGPGSELHDVAPASAAAETRTRARFMAAVLRQRRAKHNPAGRRLD